MIDITFSTFISFVQPIQFLKYLYEFLKISKHTPHRKIKNEIYFSKKCIYLSCGQKCVMAKKCIQTFQIKNLSRPKHLSRPKNLSRPKIQTNHSSHIPTHRVPLWCSWLVRARRVFTNFNTLSVVNSSTTVQRTKYRTQVRDQNGTDYIIRYICIVWRDNIVVNLNTISHSSLLCCFHLCASCSNSYRRPFPHGCWFDRKAS